MTRARRSRLGLMLLLLSSTSGAQLSSTVEAEGLQAAILESVLAARRDPDGARRLSSRAQRLSARFGAQRAELEACGGSFGLALVAWGREGALVPATSVAPRVDGRRVEYARGPLTEWYVNEARGLEHGFTVESAPEGRGALRLELAVEGGLVPQVLSNGRDAQLVDASGRPAFRYQGLCAFDAQGRELETVLVAQGARLAIVVLDQGAVYPLVVDPWIVTEEADLDGSTVEAGDRAGFAVDVDGERAVVGVPRDEIGNSEPGTTFVFVRSGTTWAEEARLSNVIAFLDIEFGASVDLCGDVLLVGAPKNEGASFSITEGGSVGVYVRSGSTWSLSTEYKGAVSFGEVGRSVGLSPTSAAFGAPRVQNVGRVYFYGVSGPVFTAQGSFAGGNADDLFGWSVSADGDTVAIGAPGDDDAGSAAGACFVYVRTGSTWSLQATLTAADTTAGDEFGTSVALAGDTVLIGAPGQDGAAGAAYAFTRSGTVWTEQDVLVGSDTAADDRLGHSVAIWGDLAMVGAPLHDEGGSSAGAAYLFERVGGAWGEASKLTSSSPAAGDVFGSSVAGDADTLVVGAYLENHLGADSGAAHVFRIAPGATSYCTAGTSASGCQATLASTGTASATASSGFVLSTSGVEGQKDGLYFFGTNGRQANPWGNGTSYQCVVPPVVRVPIMTGAGTLGACDGSFALDLNALWCPACPKPAKNPGSGALVQAQLWYRDPLSTSNQTTSLSDALEFSVLP